MTANEFRTQFQALQADLQEKIRNATTETILSDDEQDELQIRFGDGWRVYFFGKGFTPSA